MPKCNPWPAIRPEVFPAFRLHKQLKDRIVWKHDRALADSINEIIANGLRLPYLVRKRDHIPQPKANRRTQRRVQQRSGQGVV